MTKEKIEEVIKRNGVVTAQEEKVVVYLTPTALEECVAELSDLFIPKISLTGNHIMDLANREQEKLKDKYYTEGYKKGYEDGLANGKSVWFGSQKIGDNGIKA